MAKASIIPPPQPTPPPPRIHLDLSIEEAGVILALLGSVAGEGQVRDIANSVFKELVRINPVQLVHDALYYQRITKNRSGSKSPITGDMTLQ